MKIFSKRSILALSIMIGSTTLMSGSASAEAIRELYCAKFNNVADTSQNAPLLFSTSNGKIYTAKELIENPGERINVDLGFYTVGDPYFKLNSPVKWTYWPTYGGIADFEKGPGEDELPVYEWSTCHDYDENEANLPYCYFQNKLEMVELENKTIADFEALNILEIKNSINDGDHKNYHYQYINGIKLKDVIAFETDPNKPNGFASQKGWMIVIGHDQGDLFTTEDDGIAVNIKVTDPTIDENCTVIVTEDELCNLDENEDGIPDVSPSYNICDDGNTTDGNTTDGNTTDGNTTDGNTTDGNTTDGNTTDGNTTDGNTTDGNTTGNENDPLSGGLNGGGCSLNNGLVVWNGLAGILMALGLLVPAVIRRRK